MSGERVPLIHDLLGAVVGIQTDREDLAERVRVRHADMPALGSRVGPSGMITIQEDSYGVHLRLPGRPVRTLPALEHALRELDEAVLDSVVRSNPELIFARAGVVSWNGQGVLIPALTRRGKSLLTLALLQAGARYLSDELMILDPTLRTLYPLPLAIRLTEEGAAQFPDLGPRFFVTGGERLLRPLDLGPKTLSGEVPLAAVAIPEWEPAASDEVLPLPRAEACRKVEEILLLGRRSPEEAPALALEVAGAGVRTFTLRWRNPHSAATRLLEALNSN